MYCYHEPFFCDKKIGLRISCEDCLGGPIGPSDLTIGLSTFVTLLYASKIMWNGAVIAENRHFCLRGTLWAYNSYYNSQQGFAEIRNFPWNNMRSLFKGGRRIYNIPWLLIHGSKANFSGASTTSQKITRTTWKTYFCVLNPFLQLSEHVLNVFLSKQDREVTQNRNLSVKNLDIPRFPMESYYDKARSADGISVARIIDIQPKTLRNTASGRAYIAVQ